MRETPDSWPRASVDHTPWAHPFLTGDHLARFRRCSEQVYRQALAGRERNPRRLNVGFAVNMAQSMYKWATLASKYGADATLYLNPQDHSAISRPEWEEFDGEAPDVLDGRAFLALPSLPVARVPVVEPPNDAGPFGIVITENLASPGWRAALRRQLSLRVPRLAVLLQQRADLARLKLASPTLRFGPLMDFEGMYPFFQWAEMLTHHEVTCIASAPLPAYFSGKPYCALSVGGDLQIDAGRADDYGRAMRQAFQAAHLLLVTNPHTLSHCRRLGLRNAVYLPYPMDTERYCPGAGQARREWIARYGGDVFVLTTARIDPAVKGHTDAWFDAIAAVARARDRVRFMFLGWGSHARELGARIERAGLSRHFIVLPPVGKQRLIDYYRSCDVVLDQFVYGYYGATALEAAAVGRPVIMKLRAEHYAPLYDGDVAPVLNASTPEQVREHLERLLDADAERRDAGDRLREWIVRTHGEQKTVPLLLALLQLAADGRRVRAIKASPLQEPLSAAEREYHRQCLQ